MEHSTLLKQIEILNTQLQLKDVRIADQKQQIDFWKKKCDQIPVPVISLDCQKLQKEFDVRLQEQIEITVKFKEQVQQLEFIVGKQKNEFILQTQQLQLNEKNKFDLKSKNLTDQINKLNEQYEKEVTKTQKLCLQNKELEKQLTDAKMLLKINTSQLKQFTESYDSLNQLFANLKIQIDFQQQQNQNQNQLVQQLEKQQTEYTNLITQLQTQIDQQQSKNSGLQLALKRFFVKDQLNQSQLEKLHAAVKASSAQVLKLQLKNQFLEKQSNSQQQAFIQDYEDLVLKFANQKLSQKLNKQKESVLFTQRVDQQNDELSQLKSDLQTYQNALQEYADQIDLLSNFASQQEEEKQKLLTDIAEKEQTQLEMQQKINELLQRPPTAEKETLTYDYLDELEMKYQLSQKQILELQNDLKELKEQQLSQVMHLQAKTVNIDEDHMFSEQNSKQEYVEETKEKELKETSFGNMFFEGKGEEKAEKSESQNQAVQLKQISSDSSHHERKSVNTEQSREVSVAESVIQFPNNISIVKNSLHSSLTSEAQFNQDLKQEEPKQNLQTIPEEEIEIVFTKPKMEFEESLKPRFVKKLLETEPTHNNVEIKTKLPPPKPKLKLDVSKLKVEDKIQLQARKSSISQEEPLKDINNDILPKTQDEPQNKNEILPSRSQTQPIANMVGSDKFDQISITEPEQSKKSEIRSSQLPLSQLKQSAQSNDMTSFLQQNPFENMSIQNNQSMIVLDQTQVVHYESLISMQEQDSIMEDQMKRIEKDGKPLEILRSKK